MEGGGASLASSLAVSSPSPPPPPLPTSRIPSRIACTSPSFSSVHTKPGKAGVPR